MATVTVGPGKDHATIDAATNAASGGDTILVYAAGSPYTETAILDAAKNLIFEAEEGQSIEVTSAQSYTVQTSAGQAYTWRGNWKIGGGTTATYRVATGTCAVEGEMEVVVVEGNEGLLVTTGSLLATGVLTTSGGGASNAATWGIDSYDGTVQIADLRTGNTGRGLRVRRVTTLEIDRWEHEGGSGAHDVAFDAADSRMVAGSYVGAFVWHKITTGFLSNSSATYNDRCTFENGTIDTCVDGFSFDNGTSQIIKNCLFTNFSGKAITRADAGGTAPDYCACDDTEANSISNFTAPTNSLYEVDPGYADKAGGNWRPTLEAVGTGGAAPAKTTADYYGDAWTDPAPIGAANLEEIEPLFEVLPGVSDLNAQRYKYGRSPWQSERTDETQIVRTLLAQNNTAKAAGGYPLVHCNIRTPGGLKYEATYEIGLSARPDMVAVRCLWWMEDGDYEPGTGEQDWQIDLVDAGDNVLASWYPDIGRGDETIELDAYPEPGSLRLVVYPGLAAGESQYFVATDLSFAVYPVAIVTPAMTEEADESGGRYLQFARATEDRPVDVATVSAMLTRTNDPLHSSYTSRMLYSLIMPAGDGNQSPLTDNMPLPGNKSRLWAAIYGEKAAGGTITISGVSVAGDWPDDTLALYRCDLSEAAGETLTITHDDATIYVVTIYEEQVPE